MPRLLTKIGTCVLACLAIGAVGASTAMGEATPDRFTSQTYPVTVHGLEKHGDTTIVTEAGTVGCDVTLHGELGEASQTLTLKPTYVNCTAFGFLSATVAAEGCHRLYHVTTKLGADRYQAHLDNTCPEGQSIKITAGTCKLEIKGQTALTTVDIDDMTTSPPSLNDITIKDTVEGVKYTVTQDGFGCPFGGTGNKTDGQFTSHGALTLRGYIPGTGTQQAIHIG